MFKLNYIMDENKMLPNYKIIKRYAVRGVIIKEGKILLIHTNKGDYKFPGGGSIKGEKIEGTLIREVAEETGFLIKSIGQILGEVLERKLCDYELETVFEQHSIYIQCEIDYSSFVEQNLDSYELEQEFQPEFITLESALENNKALLQMKKKDMNSWLERETAVMMKLMEM